jgi:hypothetical protein
MAVCEGEAAEGREEGVAVCGREAERGRAESHLGLFGSRGHICFVCIVYHGRRAYRFCSVCIVGEGRKEGVPRAALVCAAVTRGTGVVIAGCGGGGGERAGRGRAKVCGLWPTARAWALRGVREGWERGAERGRAESGPRAWRGLKRACVRGCAREGVVLRGPR